MISAASHAHAHRRMRRAWGARGLLLAALLIPTGCTYFKHVDRQDELVASLRTDPELRTIKHLLEHDRFSVYGRVADAGSDDTRTHALAVAAFSSALKPDEIVDICHLGRSGSYYAVHLPAGKFRLIALRDRNDDGVFESDEIVAFQRLALTESTYPDRIVRLEDLIESSPQKIPLATLPLPVPPDPARAAEESVFYPRGTIRALDDPIFSAAMVELGMYDPAAFTETAPLMFYALEEEYGHKIPVIFVHGIAGSARNFAPIVEQMDRDRYKPWFFHYPSGADLNQSGKLFYDIFLSGKVIPPSPMPVIIVAHSMGGLVVREAMNFHTAGPDTANVRMIITLASPFGGMKSAGVGVRRAPLVVPAWRDLDPAGDFIAQLFRTPRSTTIEHRALYATRRLKPSAPESGTDGVVPVASQLAPPARAEFTRLDGFQSGHAEILADAGAVALVIAHLNSVPNLLPEEHLRHLAQGGFAVSLGDGYTSMEKYFIHRIGRYFRALVHGDVMPLFPIQEHFIAAARGQVAPEGDAETAWARFQRDFPQLAHEAESVGPGSEPEPESSSAR